MLSTRNSIEKLKVFFLSGESIETREKGAMSIKDGGEEMGFMSSDAGLSGSTGSGAYVPPAEQDGVAGSGAESGNAVVDMFKQTSDPRVSLFHVLFKVTAVVVYLFGSWFSDSFVILFVTCILCLAFDFWTVKNVTGRLMVGLRWWNDIGEDGSNQWRFESIDNPESINQNDYRIFWYSQYIHFVLWVVFGFLDVISGKLTWFLLVVVALGLSGSNIYGYWQCSKDARAKIQGAVQGVVQQHALSALTSGIGGTFSRLTGGSGGGAAGTPNV